MDEKYLRENFSKTSNSELAQTLNSSIRSVIRHARRMGLSKDREYIRQISIERRSKIVNIPRGETHYKWKGGKSWSRFRDKRYIEWRNSVLDRDRYIYQDCTRKCKKYEKGLAAHHIKPWAEYPNLRFDISNGLTLCRACHMKRHGKCFSIIKILCGCGCGTLIDNKDIYGRDRRYVNHHYWRS